ncbi:MAG: alkaline phosphatase [Halothece sp.]
MAKNIITIVPDGMGWEMARAGAIAKLIDEGHEGDTLDDFFTEGKGEGSSFMDLEGFTWATTYPMTVEGDKNNSAFEGNPLERPTGEGELREGFDPENFEFDPTFNPEQDPEGGNLVGWDVERGGPNPWTTPDPEYIKEGYTGSSQAGTNIFAGEKTYNPALGVDLFEEPVENITDIAKELGKSTGTISDVPVNHATPASPVVGVNHRNKLDEDYPDMDNVLQQMLRGDEADLMLGGGHPWDQGNFSGRSGEYNFNYITEDNYEHLSNNPNAEDNRYGVNFLERGPGASEKLMDTVAELDPTEGDRLFGLYGARGQNGNLPMRSGDGSYDRTGYNTFAHRGSQLESEDGEFVDPEYARPLMPGETEEAFIERELDENPTIMDMAQASLDFLSQNDEGFFLQIELGDYDWVLHDNNLDAMLGRHMDLDETVEIVKDWVEDNGGWEENLVMVVPDHDHYLTLNDNFPELYREKGPEALTEAFEPQEAGHHWGADPEDKYEWGTHTNRPVPVYYQGEGSDILDSLIGEGYEIFGEQVPGIENHIDLVHVFETMKEAFLRSEESSEQPALPVFGSSEDDILEGTIDFEGNGDLIFSGDGNNLVDTSLTPGGNRIYGGDGNDEFLAGNNDRIFAGDGDDILDSSHQGGGKNRLYGESGNDLFIAGNHDRLIGGNGNDRFFLSQGEGHNTVTGGAGEDQFWLAAGQLPNEANIITDFTSGEDVFGFGGVDLEFSDLSIGASEESPEDAVIGVNDQDLAVLLNVQADSLTEADFVFV